MTKPFDFEAFKAGAVALTRAGEEVHFVAYVPEACEGQRLITRAGEIVSVRSIIGTYWFNGTKDSRDLVAMKPVKRTVWVNLYPNGIAGHHPSKEKADKEASLTRIGSQAYIVEIEE